MDKALIDKPLNVEKLKPTMQVRSNSCCLLLYIDQLLGKWEPIPRLNGLQCTFPVNSQFRLLVFFFFFFLIINRRRSWSGIKFEIWVIERVKKEEEKLLAPIFIPSREWFQRKEEKILSTHGWGRILFCLLMSLILMARTFVLSIHAMHKLFSFFFEVKIICLFFLFPY